MLLDEPVDGFRDDYGVVDDGDDCGGDDDADDGVVDGDDCDGDDDADDGDHLAS